MYAKVTSLGVTGLAGYIVQVEADLSGGLPQFNLVGLPDSAVKESSERVRSAIKNLHYEWPASRITINLAPADVRKTGPVYDLPVFVGIMAAQGKLPAPGSERAFLGELGLDGTLRPVTGVLPMALAAVQNGVKELFLPAENAAEAAVPCTRLTVTLPSSSGWRSTSSVSRANSGSSSRNSTPLCARLTSPGRGTDPPPTMAVELTLWCGLRKGRCLISPVPPRSSPATE